MLKQRRIEKGLSQRALSDEGGVAMRAIASWEAAESVPSALSAFKVAGALGLDDAERDLLSRAIRQG